MGQITATRNLVATKVVRHAGQSLRCSWSIACRRCSNYIFILDLIPGFNGLGKDDCKTRQETFNFWDLVLLIQEVLGYVIISQAAITVTTILSSYLKVRSLQLIWRSGTYLWVPDLQLSCTDLTSKFKFGYFSTTTVQVRGFYDLTACQGIRIVISSPNDDCHTPCPIIPKLCHIRSHKIIVVWQMLCS